jgi:uronate dehydrogenase
VDHKPADVRRLSIWVSPRDLAQLFRIGLTHPAVHFEIVYGASKNVRAWWDNANAYRLGYQPEDEAQDYAEHAHTVSRENPEDQIGAQFHGGPFCAIEFAGDVRRIT